jgi:hypothetical protein
MGNDPPFKKERKPSNKRSLAGLEFHADVLPANDWTKNAPQKLLKCCPVELLPGREAACGERTQRCRLNGRHSSDDGVS